MSGFAGLVRIGATPELVAEDARILEKFARAIAFRGPDESNSWQHTDVQFCFSFLKTGPAPQAKTQPCSLDGRVWLLGDLRLDGRDEVLRRFAQRGEQLESSLTDEELLLHVFQIFGENGVAGLDGDFSLVLWDAKKKKLTAFRDLTGSKAFFYFVGDGLLCFSNTLDALRASPGFDGSLDRHFLADYLLTSWCPEPERTVYSQVHRLAPGHSFEYSREGMKVARTAQLDIEELIRYKSDQEYVDHYRELLHSAVTDRLTHETNIVFMSGGLDSTTVAAEAQRICQRFGGTRSVSAQAVDYRPLFDDREGDEAKRVADYLELPFELLQGGEYIPFSGWDATGFPMPEPKHEPFEAFHVEAHRRASKHCRVALSGDGGDDVLLGQAWPYLRNLLKQGRVISAAAGLIRHIWNTRQLPVLGLGIRSRIRSRFGVGTAPETFPDWVNPEFASSFRLQERFAALQQKPKSEHPNHPWAYAMLTGPFWPNVLEGEDAAWSGVPLEVRAPLLDRRMIRYLLRLPALPWCMDKQLVRRAMVGELPGETLSRPKSPLAEDPLEVHIRKKQWKPGTDGELTEILKEMVDPERLENCMGQLEADKLNVCLRPISLDRWLKSVEMKRRIQ